MNTVFCLAGIVIKELYRRKDFYVLFVVTALITLIMGSVKYFHEDKIVRYIKDICLLLIWVSSLVIALATAARQIPAERESRTIFPLLAKPVTRWQLLAGKFVGCWLACGIALLVFYLFFGVVAGTKEGHVAVGQYFQAFWMQWCMLGIVISMVLFGSVVLSAPSANITISFAIIVAILILGSHLHRLAAFEPPPFGLLLSALYFLIPHFEWYYSVRDRLIFDQHLLAWSDVILATGYAAAYAGLVLFATWLVFRRKILTT